MNEVLVFIINLLAAGLAFGTPLLWATLGEIISERAGVLNLGIEGLMLVGAMAGVWASLTTGSAFLGLLFASLVAASLALLHALLSVTLRADQVVSGLGLGFLGGGIASVLGAPLLGRQGDMPRFHRLLPGGLAEFPALENLLSQNILVWFSLLAAPTLWWFIFRTRWGLHLRAVGENPAAADGLGINVILHRYLAVILGGAFAGLGGASLSLALTPGYVDGMTAGLGFVALGLTIFARWQPLNAIVGTVLFGALRRLPLDLQALGVGGLSDPSWGYFFNMLPYIFVILALVMMRRREASASAAPAALGKAYVRGERG